MHLKITLPFLISGYADLYGPIFFILLLCCLVTAVLGGALALLFCSVRACARAISTRYSFDLHIPRMVYRSQAVKDRGRLLRKEVSGTVRILEGARRAHIELGVLPTGASDCAESAAGTFKVKSEWHGRAISC